MGVILRFRSLDSLRGIAALAVVFHHCCRAFRGYLRAPLNPLKVNFWTQPFSVLHWTPVHLFLNGATAVLLFFVLSGFVLTLSIERGGDYPSYVMRRICRIYLPFAVAIGFAAALDALVQPRTVPGLSDWFNQSWNLPLSAQLVIGHLLMTGMLRFISLDNPVWSLAPELRISIILPGLIWALRRWPRAAIIVTIGTAFVAQVVVLVGPKLIEVPEIAASWLMTVVYVHLFAIGCLLALQREAVRTAVLGLSRVKYAALWLFALALMWLPIANWSTILWAGAGSAALIALCISDDRAITILTGAVPLWLGKVSFSLYLVHLPILLTVFHTLYGRVPGLVATAITIGLSLITAELFNRFVERPSMHLAKRLPSLVGRREPVAEPL
jgi:peptidoglycan/LPS O-acetylase OafA/YrhL